MATDVTNIKDAKSDKDKTKLPTRDQILDLKKRTDEVDGKMSELRGEKGSMLKTGSDDLNIHKKAFKDVVKLSNMDDLAQAEYLAHYDLYKEALGINPTTDMFRTSA